ncbi:hypothetical protein PR202_gb20236 [Eleusine coracana subsp. coracana]|uniref:F-box domain-containing protein n=1 Tax=Eleusine coracana subsp. coracana TaxID=191504 RepID=A0AAV5F816_ELECO|nr:hypothetical protein PR202_gb20216 [Eleusine coracana subsp. coracana]GJN31794.1 hypothetical protein PR202_gb20236 [Eleusine coracana subsp. coracana]
MSPRRGGGRCISLAAPPLALEDEDLLSDILLRLPPQPSSLARAASVCKIWRRLVSSPGLHRRYRARQSEPPLLGMFMSFSGYPIFHSVMDPPDAIPYRRFLLWRNAGDCWDFHGVRHGRALVFNHTRHEFIVWDPATGDRRCVPMPQKLRDEGTTVCNGAVMCAAGGQGHVHGRDCHSSPFQLVMIGISKDEKQAVSSVYSSGIGEWGDFSSVAIRYMYEMTAPSILIGDSLYWLLDDTENGIFEFHLGRRSLSVFQFPPDMDDLSDYNCQIIPGEDGGIGLAGTTTCTFDMWDRKVSIDGDETWVLRKTVKLEEITGLSRDVRGHMIIHGYDEDDNVIFLRTDIGCFMVQLQSMQFKNLGKRDFLTTCTYHPYRSFYSCKVQ